MYSLFLLLFKKSYWRMLFRKATWVEAWSNLRRAHKDKRARRHLRRFGYTLIVPFLCLGYLVWLARSGALYVLPFVAAVFWWRHHRAKQNSASLRITPLPEPAVRELSAGERESLRAYFAELALFYAVMVDRVGSEWFLKEKHLPEGFVVTSRRIHLDLLRSKGLWDKMSRADRVAMMAPDGHWEWAQINRVSLSMEPLRLLRWILRIDFYLPTVGHQLRGDYSLASELVHAPQKLFDGKDLGTPAMVRIGRDAAQQYLVRCVAEGIHRGVLEASNEESAEWARRTAMALGGKQHEDLVLDGKLVSETTEDGLQWATSLSRRRRDFLAWAISLLEGATPPELSDLSVSTEEEEVALSPTD